MRIERLFSTSLIAAFVILMICRAGSAGETAGGEAGEEAAPASTEEQPTEPAAPAAPEPPPSKAGEEWVFSRSAEVFFTRSQITVSQYRACVEAGACDAPAAYRDCNWHEDGRDDHPVNCIDWKQAAAVCGYLGGRLPAEDEWHREASDNESRDWPWGTGPEVTCDHAIWGDGDEERGCGRNSTWPVCSKPEGNSVSGLCDMSGNVWEWVDEAHDDNRKVLRGCSWGCALPGFLRSSFRFWDYPSARNSTYGVRCAR